MLCAPGPTFVGIHGEVKYDIIGNSHEVARLIEDGYVPYEKPFSNGYKNRFICQAWVKYDCSQQEEE